MREPVEVRKADYTYQFNGAFTVCKTPKNLHPRPYPVDALDAKDPVWECDDCGELQCGCLR
jgi:hypothetical protein